MTKETAIGMLRVARTGDEMLAVLESFSDDESLTALQASSVPTLEPMEF